MEKRKKIGKENKNFIVLAFICMKCKGSIMVEKLMASKSVYDFSEFEHSSSSSYTHCWDVIEFLSISHDVPSFSVIFYIGTSRHKPKNQAYLRL